MNKEEKYTILDFLNSDVRIISVANHIYRKILHSGGVNPKKYNDVKVVIVFKDKDLEDAKINNFMGNPKND